MADQGRFFLCRQMTVKSGQKRNQERSNVIKKQPIVAYNSLQWGGGMPRKAKGG